MPEKAEGATRASLELLYNISREFATALDLRTILQRVVFLSMKTVGATRGSIIVLDNSGTPMESAIIAGGQVMDHTTQRLRATLDKGLAGWVAKTKEPALVTNTSKDRRWLQRRYEDQEENLARSAVSAPLLVRDRLVGVMTLAHQSIGFFTEEHLSLVQAIADQAAISVLNARLYEESQRQARVMTALAESAATITGSLNQEEVLNRILEQVMQALNVEAAAIALIEPGTDELVFRAASGWKDQSMIGSRLAAGQGIAGWAVQEGRVAVVHDARLDPRFNPEHERQRGLLVTAIAAAPIRSRGQIIGVLEAVNPIRTVFGNDASLVMTGIGSLAGTAIRHAQLFERLQAAHQRYQQLFEDSIDPILITDKQGKIIEANRQAQVSTSYQRADLLDMQIAQIQKPSVAHSPPDLLSINGDSKISYEASLHTKEGSEIPVEVIIHEVEIDDVPCLQWILRDISVRKSLDQLREDLIAMIYHDLQSPLSNVISSLEVAEMMVNPNDTDMKQLIGIASRSTERIQRLISSLLDINRLEAGQQVGTRQDIDPEVLLKEAIEIVGPTLRGKEQQVQVETKIKLPHVLVDPDMIRRVLINLLENAVKYTPSGSTITTGGTSDEDSVTFWIKDNGPGIPASEHRRIFDKYTRVTGTGSPKGLGLGLAYCRLAVEAHGGRIWVESQPDFGSKFLFTLPRLKR
jgi:PAS domain S-box-containing protein